MNTIPVRVRCSGLCAVHCDERGHAERGDPVEAWLKRKRDEYTWESWHIIDDLLDDYRLHADTGTPLSDGVRKQEEPS